MVADALPTLAVLAPFDLGMPLRIPDEVKLPDGSSSKRRACEHFARNRSIQNHLGQEVTISVKSDMPRYVDMNLVTDSESFPYGTTAVLGPALRLRSPAGRLVESWREEAIALMGTPSSKDFPGCAVAIDPLRDCRLDVAIDAFACGGACLRLFVWLPGTPSPDLVASCARLLEFALYGDIPTPDKVSGRLDKTNRALRDVRQAVVAQFGDNRLGRVLNREETVFAKRPDGVSFRWTSNVVMVEQGKPLDRAINLTRPSHEDRGPTTGSLIDLKTSSFRYRDDTWMAIISVTDPDTYYRVLYVLCVSEAITILMMNLARDLDEKLSSSMLSREAEPYSDRDLRNIRFFTQAVRGLASTWRISVYDMDIAIADSRARQYQHERYQNHLATASETLYALEKGRLADQQRRRSDAIALGALWIAAVTLWSLVLASKDVGSVWKDVRPYLSLHPQDVADYLLDAIVGSLVVVALLIIAILSKLLARRWLSKRH